MPSEWPEPAPRVASWDPYVDTWGDEAVELCSTAGLILDPWQELSLRIWLGTRLDDPTRWAHRRNGMIVPRQDGKGAVLEARQLVGLFLIDDDRLIIHTAHEFKTAEESFGRLASLIEDSPLRHRLARNGIRTGRGQEAIILRDGSRAKFLARSKRSGRGFTCDVLIYDEAMDGLTPRMVGASQPTMSARPNPQSIYTATAGDDTSEVLAQVRDDGIAGTERLAYVEYSAGDPADHVGDDVDLDDRDQWFQANPAMWGDHPRMTVEAVEEDRKAMDEENFARERLCLWWIGKRASVIDPDDWQALVESSKPSDTLTFAVDVPPERDSASIAVASDRPDGKRHWEVVDRRDGTAWVLDRLVELAKKWKPLWVALDPSSPAGSLLDDVAKGLEGVKVKVLRVSGNDLKAACGQFLDRVNDEGAVVHDGPHSADLASAVDALRKREYPEGGFVWHRRDTASDISPAMSVTLANFALSKPPKKRQRSGRASY